MKLDKLGYALVTSVGILFFALLIGMLYDATSAGYQPTATSQAPTATLEPTATATPRPTKTPRERVHPSKTPTVVLPVVLSTTIIAPQPTGAVCDPCAALQTIAAAQATIASWPPD